MRAWRDLVTASLIGTERAVVPAVRLPGLPSAGAADAGDPAARVCWTAAGSLADRGPPRGLLTWPRCDRGRSRFPSARATPRPAVSPAAAARLARMLSGESTPACWPNG